jgi:hypothetical protein
MATFPQPARLLGQVLSEMVATKVLGDRYHSIEKSLSALSPVAN